MKSESSCYPACEILTICCWVPCHENVAPISLVTFVGAAETLLACLRLQHMGWTHLQGVRCLLRAGRSWYHTNQELDSVGFADLRSDSGLEFQCYSVVDRLPHAVAVARKLPRTSTYFHRNLQEQSLAYAIHRRVQENTMTVE